MARRVKEPRTLIGSGYCSGYDPIPYVRREELGPEGQQLWDSIVNGRGEEVVTGWAPAV